MQKEFPRILLHHADGTDPSVFAATYLSDTKRLIDRIVPDEVWDSYRLGARG